jgi:hypothetical protein
MPQSTRKLTAALASLLAGPMALSDIATAQQIKPVPQAFAAVQAPDSAVEMCHSTSARAALDCARNKCQRKAHRGSCFAVTVCEPSGWAGIMGVQLAEAQFANVLCGAPTREALIAALRAFCEGHPGLKQCTITQTWGPDGALLIVNQTWTPADFGK